MGIQNWLVQRLLLTSLAAIGFGCGAEARSFESDLSFNSTNSRPVSARLSDAVRGDAAIVLGSPAVAGVSGRLSSLRKHVRVAQVNFDFTQFNDRPSRRRAAPSRSKVKVYKAPNRKVRRVAPASQKPFFNFFKPKQVVTAPGSSLGMLPGKNYYIIHAPDGRAYRVYPKGKNYRPGNNGFGNIWQQPQVRSSGYRTMCVRTCDGYYYPVSNATRRSRLRRDNNICESSCGVPAKLFYYSNAGGSVDSMVDLKGKKYASMKFAYKYRKKAVNNCRCKEQPWAQSEIIRHEQYAMDEIDRGVRRVKLVKVAQVNVASVKVDLTSVYGHGSGAVKGVSAVAKAENGAGLTSSSDAGNPTEDSVTSSNAAIDAGDVIGDNTGDEASEIGVVESDGHNDIPYVRTVANSRAKFKRLQARKRYRMNAQRMKNWWRSNRY